MVDHKKDNPGNSVPYKTSQYVNSRKGSLPTFASSTTQMSRKFNFNSR